MIRMGYSREAVLRRTRAFGNVIARTRGAPAGMVWLNSIFAQIAHRVRDPVGNQGTGVEGGR